jgi:hypothetical protein
MKKILLILLPTIFIIACKKINTCEDGKWYPIINTLSTVDTIYITQDTIWNQSIYTITNDTIEYQLSTVILSNGDTVTFPHINQLLLGTEICIKD